MPRSPDWPESELAGVDFIEYYIPYCFFYSSACRPSCPEIDALQCQLQCDASPDSSDIEEEENVNDSLQQPQVMNLMV